MAQVRPATPDDAQQWVATYLEALAHAYAPLLPPEFIVLQRRRAHRRVEELRAELAGAPDVPASAWVAEDDI
ncbi:MAG: hypothetical protein ABI890_14150, partial [Lapillicoccus sp.]